MHTSKGRLCKNRQGLHKARVMPASEVAMTTGAGAMHRRTEALTMARTAILDADHFDKVHLAWPLRPVVEILLGLEVSGVVRVGEPRPKCLLIELGIPAIKLRVVDGSA